MESKVETVEPSVNVLWQNLIALNTSLFNENKEKSQQLIETKKKLQEEQEESMKLRSKVEGYQKEVMHKNQKIDQLTTKLKAVRQLTEGLNNDSIETKPLLVENHQGKSTPIRYNENEISIQRKISHFFPHGCINIETKASVQDNSDASLNTTKSATNELDDQEVRDENLLIALPDQEVRDESLLIALPDQEIRDEKFSTPLRENTHNSKKGKVCNECGRHFSSYQSLQRHEMIHTGVRPFACPKCSKKFVRSDHFKHHMRSHRGTQEDSSLICDVCNSKYSSKQNLQRHKKNVHKCD